jgi:glycosyltransferase involved in cell wall biosynthesis
MGDFIPLKRHHIFLQAALQAQTYIPNLRVVVVGAERPTTESRAYRSSLEDWFKRGKVIVRSWQDEELASVFNVLDILVIASTIETGPLVLFQGLACGTPVISTAVGHAPILLGQEFLPGLLFEIDQVTDLAGKLVHLLQATDQRKMMQLAARHVAQTKLDLNIAQQKMVELVNRQLKG